MKIKLLGSVILLVVCGAAYAEELPARVLVDKTTELCSCVSKDGAATPIFRSESAFDKQMKSEQIPQKIEKLVSQYEQAPAQDREKIRAGIVDEMVKVRQAQLAEMKNRIDSSSESEQYQKNLFESAGEETMDHVKDMYKADRKNLNAWVEHYTKKIIASDGDLSMVLMPVCECETEKYAAMIKEQEARRQALEAQLKEWVAEYKKSTDPEKTVWENKIKAEVKKIRKEQLFWAAKHEKRVFAYFNGMKKDNRKDIKETNKRRKYWKKEMTPKAQQIWAEKKTDELLKNHGKLADVLN